MVVESSIGFKCDRRDGVAAIAANPGAMAAIDTLVRDEDAINFGNDNLRWGAREHLNAIRALH